MATHIQTFTTTRNTGSLAAFLDDIKVILASVEVGSLSLYLQGFIHSRWCRISAINSKNRTDAVQLILEIIFFLFETQEEKHIGPLTWHVCLCFLLFCKDVGGFMMFVCRWRVLRLLVVLRGTKHVEVFPPSSTPHLGAYAVHDPLRSHHSKVYPVLGSVTENLVGI